MSESVWFSVRFDYGTVLLDDASRARRAAAALARPCFAPLRRLSARVGDRWSRHVPATRETIAEYLLDRSLEAVSLDSGRADEPTASAQIQTGNYPGPRPVAATRFYAYVAVPILGSPRGVVEAVCELAAALAISAGFVAVEPSYSRAHEVALGFRLPRERPGLSAQRRRERRGRDWHDGELSERISGIEWGTFLGPRHLAGIALDALRATNAFARVDELVPGELAFLQLADDPTDDLGDAIESRHAGARRALAPILVDLSDVHLD